MAMLTRLRRLIQKMTGSYVVTPEEIESVIRLPVLGVVPHLERRKQLGASEGPMPRRIQLEGRWRSRLLTNFPLDSPAAAVYASLAEQLRDRSVKEPRRIILVTSAVSGEGTSLTCANLAIAGGRRGIKTLIIEGHMRSPRISSVMGLELEPGITGCLNRALLVGPCIQKAVWPQVDILPSGRPAPYPGALWSTSAFEQLLVEVRATYDLVLIESGPLLLYQDTVQLAQKSDAVLVVHQFGRTSSERLSKGIEKLGDTRERILGVILNDAPGSSLR